MTDQTTIKNIDAALAFVEANDLKIVWQLSIQLARCETTEQVDRLLSLGFKPHRYEGDGYSSPGVLEMNYGTELETRTHLYAALEGDDLFDYAESKC